MFEVASITQLDLVLHGLPVDLREIRRGLKDGGRSQANEAVDNDGTVHHLRLVVGESRYAGLCTTEDKCVDVVRAFERIHCLKMHPDWGAQ